MRIINLVDNVSKVNFGIWNAAVATAASLNQGYGVQSEIWFPAQSAPSPLPDFSGAEAYPLQTTSRGAIPALIRQKNLEPANTLIISHGCWRYPTMWGRAFQRLGFKWLYVPHGMLEPWGMQQKRWKKKLFYSLFEYPAARHADAVRAVGKPEYDNLIKSFPQTLLIPNGTEKVDFNVNQKPETEVNILFMARLHHKKGVLPLVQAWSESILANHPIYNLFIAGPDDGERPTVDAFLRQSGITNISVLGGVYGEDKINLLKKSQFYILPSFSEGFPTSVVEAMQYGLLPMITTGCNFPEAFNQPFTIQITPNPADIKKALNNINNLPRAQYLVKAAAAQEFINKGYTLDIIARLQHELAVKLLS